MTEIEKLRELEAKATPGPWTRQTLEPQTLGYEWIDAPGYTHVAVCRDLTKFDQTNRLHLRPELDEITANTEFIVAARNTLPALLASLASLEAQNARLRELGEALCEAMAHDFHNHTRESEDAAVQAQIAFRSTLEKENHDV